MSEVKWLLVGAGDIARKRVGAALNETPNSRVIAVCDRDTERASEVAGELEADAVYGDLAQALGSTDADAVYIATPVGLHVPQAVACMRAGKHVLVEKPLGAHGAQASEAAIVAEQTGVKAGCAYFRRCSPRYEMARQMLDAGEFGQVVLVRLAYYSWFSPAADDPKRWRVVRGESGGGPLSDMGTHMFDVLIGLFGLPETVFARTGALVNDWDVEDSSAIVMTLPGGALVTGSFHWNSKTWSHEFEIVGTEARVKWHPYDGPAVVRTVGRDIETIEMPNADNVHLPLVADFVRAVREDRPPAVPLAEAAKTNVLLDAVYLSAEQRAEVSL